MFCFVFFFFKQKTAYEILRSDWSSDVCSSDLARHLERAQALDPDNIGTLGVVAVLLNSLGRVDEALVINRYSLTRDPLNSALLHNTGAMQFSLGRLDQAMA